MDESLKYEEFEKKERKEKEKKKSQLKLTSRSLSQQLFLSQSKFFEFFFPLIPLSLSLFLSHLEILFSHHLLLDLFLFFFGFFLAKKLSDNSVKLKDILRDNIFQDIVRIWGEQKTNRVCFASYSRKIFLFSYYNI